MTRFAIGVLLLSGASAASAETDFGVRTVGGERGVVHVATHAKVSQQQFTGQAAVVRETKRSGEAWTPLRAGSGNRVEERIHRVVDHFAAEMDHLSECVLSGAEPLTSGEEGLKDLIVMMAIYDAAKAGKTVTLAG